MSATARGVGTGVAPACATAATKRDQAKPVSASSATLTTSVVSPRLAPGSASRPTAAPIATTPIAGSRKRAWVCPPLPSYQATIRNASSSHPASKSHAATSPSGARQARGAGAGRGEQPPPDRPPAVQPDRRGGHQPRHAGQREPWRAGQRGRRRGGREAGHAPSRRPAPQRQRPGYQRGRGRQEAKLVVVDEGRVVGHRREQRDEP